MLSTASGMAVVTCHWSLRGWGRRDERRGEGGRRGDRRGWKEKRSLGSIDMLIARDWEMPEERRFTQDH